jgi:hypothetical protein
MLWNRDADRQRSLIDLSVDGRGEKADEIAPIRRLLLFVKIVLAVLFLD